MKKQPAKWIAENPDAYEIKGTRSFWLKGFVSPWKNWESIVTEFLEARGNSQKMQVVVNTLFGELWENRGEIEDEETVLARREEYGAELPDGVLLLTCGVDTQDDRLEFEIVGWGRFGESWGIKKGIIMGRPDADATWTALDDVICHIYRFKSGVGLPVSLTFVDEGGHFTQEVRYNCNIRQAKNMYAVKGRGGNDIPYTSPPKKQKILLQGKPLGLCWVYEIGVDAGKTIIMDNIKVQTPGRNYCHFPKQDEYGPAYFKGFLSETKEYDPKKNRFIWVKIPGHERNEPLDCRNYALAAKKALPLDLDAIEARIREAESEKSKAPPPKREHPKKRGFNDFYNEW